MIDKKQLLRANALFADLSDDELHDIVTVANPFHCEPSSTLFNQGEYGREMFLIAEGELEITVKLSGGSTINVASLGPGQSVGELALFDDGARSATAKARIATSGLRLDAKIFDLVRMMRRPGYARLLKRLAAQATSELNRMNERIDPGRAALAEQRYSALPEAVFEEDPNAARSDAQSFDLDNLAMLPLFLDFNREDLAELLTQCHRIDLPAGVRICRQGDEAHSCYVVVSGAIQIVHSTEQEGVWYHNKIALLTPGRPLGHLALLGDTQRSAHAITREKTRLLEIRRETFEAIIDQRSNVAFELLDALLHDLAFSMRVTNRRLMFHLSQVQLAEEHEKTSV